MAECTVVTQTWAACRAGLCLQVSDLYSLIIRATSIRVFVCLEWVHMPQLIQATTALFFCKSVLEEIRVLKEILRCGSLRPLLALSLQAAFDLHHDVSD